MSIFTPSRSPWPGRMLGVFRIVAGVMFVSAGTMKLFNYPPNPVPDMPPIALLSQMGIGGLLETFGGLAIVFGVLTRPVAFVLAGEMAVVYFQFHAPQSFFPTNNGGVAAVLYCFFYLYLLFAGAGAWSLDAVIARSRNKKARDVNTGPDSGIGLACGRSALIPLDPSRHTPPVLNDLQHLHAKT